MRNRFTIALLLLVVINYNYAQKTASITWNLSSVDSQKISLTVGDIEGKKETLSGGPNGMVIASYNSNGQRLNQGSFGWVKEATHNDSRYIQFDASPSAGNNLVVSKVTFNFGFAGSTASMNSNVYYSTDNWATRTQMNSDIGSLVYGNSTGANYSKDLSVAVPNGATFSVRIYPFWVGTTTTSTSKYAVHNTMIISGATSSSSQNNQLAIITSNVNEIKDVSAVSGGSILSPGVTPILDKGVCWSTNPLPTINDSKVSAGSGLGNYSATLNSLLPRTKYYVRAFAANSDGTVYGNELTFTTLPKTIPSFPGAEGFGKFTTGGRGGAVYEVTNLNDDNLPGSLRWAINQSGPRTIVFRVSGTIQLKSTLSISKGDLTIAGQTAPGDGICLRDYTLSVNANNVIIRFIRSRYGDAVSTNEDDAIHGMGYYKNIIIDHCSFSWSIDETASFYNNENFTMQWCLISESLYASIHNKGNHGYGGIWGGTNASYHHNLLAHHTSRNPRFAGGQTATCVNVDFRNNAIFNWGFNSAYGGEEGKINVVANYYKSGPATSSGVKARILDASPNPTEGKGVGQFFVDQNYVEGYAAITANNWAGGVQGSGASDPKAKATTPFPYEPIVVQNAQQAYNSILQIVGCNFPKRDVVDTRVIEETKTGTAKFGATYGGGGKGIINSQTEVGGWPELKSTAAPVDTDKDGMPDDWEKAKGLNPNDKADGNTFNAEGYTMLEVYLNELVASSITDVKKEESIPVGFELEQNYPNPFNPETTIGYKVQTSSNVSLKVYDVLGREVATLVNNYHSAGTYKVAFNVETRHGASLQSGVYFYRLHAGNFNETKKMLLVK